MMPATGKNAVIQLFISRVLAVMLNVLHYADVGPGGSGEGNRFPVGGLGCMVNLNASMSSAGSGDGRRLSTCDRYRDESGPQSKYTPVAGSMSACATSLETSNC